MKDIFAADFHAAYQDRAAFQKDPLTAHLPERGQYWQRLALVAVQFLLTEYGKARSAAMPFTVLLY